MHDAYLAELTGLRDQLKAGLSLSVGESSSESGPSTAELAQKIKSLKSTNTIEATPQRDRQKHSSAEEPITTRIRRRAESMHAGDSAAEHDAGPRSEPPQNPSSTAAPTFGDRIATKRQQNDHPEIILQVQRA